MIDLFDIQDLSHSDIDEGDMYPSLLELSMDHNGPALGSPCDDLIPITTSCNEFGDFGIVLRHFSVLAKIPVCCCCLSWAYFNKLSLVCIHVLHLLSQEI